MKIITWNCNGALRKKKGALEDLDADILVIQECEDPAQSTKEYLSWAGDYLWIGTSKNKGIGVFPKNGNKVRKLPWNGCFQIDGLESKSTSLKCSTTDLRLFLPFTINDQYTALGVWTKGSNSEAFGYMGQFWKYLQIHRKELSSERTIIIGDFNSNKIWDMADRWWSHTDVVNELEEMGIQSLYHHQKKELQGEETKPTFYLHRKEEKPYHIDYAFISKDLISKANIEVGERKDWIAVSDHMPLLITIRD